MVRGPSAHVGAIRVKKDTTHDLRARANLNSEMLLSLWVQGKLSTQRIVAKRPDGTQVRADQLEFFSEKKL